VGVAVNVAEIPGQIVVNGVAILTVGTGIGCTVIVIGLLVAVIGAAHVAVEVRTTVTMSLFASVAEVKLLLFVPALVLFTFH
jgi:hypothetical protein